MKPLTEAEITEIEQHGIPEGSELLARLFYTARMAVKMREALEYIANEGIPEDQLVDEQYADVMRAREALKDESE